VKTILLILANTLLLAAVLSIPTVLKADGTPNPSCPTKTIC